MDIKQIIEDAKEAGFNPHPVFGGLVVRHSNGSWIDISNELLKFAELTLKRASLSANEQDKRNADYHVISDSSDCFIAVSKDVAGQLIYIRDQLTIQDINEAYHALYCIADPNLTSTEPWAGLEAIANKKVGV